MATSQSNPSVFEQFKMGSDEAFRYYYNLHHYRIFNYLWRKSHDREAARDLTQECFTILHLNRAVINDEHHLKCSLYLYARRLFGAWLRGEKALEDAKRELAYAARQDCDILNDPEIVLNDYLVMRHNLRLGINDLPERKLAILVLHYYYKMTVKDIAAKFGITEQTVRNHLSQTINRLRDYL